MTTAASTDMDALKTRLKTTWEAGDFSEVAKHIETVAEDFVNRLDIRPGMKVLDVACGSGNLAIIAAQKGATVTGVDIAENLVEAAKRRADKLGLDIRFEATTLDRFRSNGGFDLVTICDCIHDLADPVRTLKEIHALLKPDGTLYAVEPKAADRLEDNLNPVATMFYGFSIFHCMTHSLARGGPGLGTFMGPAAAERLLREAGFKSFRVLEIKSQVNLFYAATP